MALNGRRVYLAGRFSRRAEFNGYADTLRSWGFTVDAKWLTEAHEWYGERDEDAITAARAFALDDLGDVVAADIVLVFTEPANPGGRNRGGRHVEFGIALGQGKDVIVVGQSENVFHNLHGSVGIPDGTIHGTTARVTSAATFEDVRDRLADWLYTAPLEAPMTQPEQPRPKTGSHNHDAAGAPTYPLYRDRCPIGCDDLTPVRMADTNIQYVGRDRLVTRRLVLAGPPQFRNLAALEDSDD